MATTQMTNGSILNTSLEAWFQSHGVPVLKVAVQKWDYDRELAVAIECVDGWSVVHSIVQTMGKHTSHFDAVLEASEAILAIWQNEHRDQEPPVLKTGNSWADIGQAWAKWKEINGLSI